MTCASLHGVARETKEPATAGSFVSTYGAVIVHAPWARERFLHCFSRLTVANPFAGTEN